LKAEIIAVGSELLRPGRRDTNGDWLTERLQRHGLEVTGRALVGDDVARLETAIRRAAAAADLVLLTGGLGPTEDDRTRDAVAAAVGAPLVRDPAMVEHIRGLFESRGLPFRSHQAKQAEKPEAARWIDNALGSAPGMLCTIDDALVVALPGVPAEMQPMFETVVVPWIRTRAPSALVRRSLKLAGRMESTVDRAIRDLYDTPELELTILAGGEGIEIQLLARGATDEEARRTAAAVEREIRDRFPEDLYGVDDETLAEVVGRELRRAGRTLSVAESCTAGLLGGAVTAVPGSSGWFRGGLLVYHDDLKRTLAGVPAETLASHGAVSEPVARALAEGVRERCGADMGLGITGIAGPGGGSAEKPVGTVHVALADGSLTEHWGVRLVGDRALIRRRAVVFALDRVRRRLRAERNGS
jgi:nicotinamide-nucleotide amidase